MVQPSWRTAAPRTHTVRCACPRRPRRWVQARILLRRPPRSRTASEQGATSASKLFSWTRRTTYVPVAPRAEAVLDLGGRRKSVLAWTHRRRTPRACAPYVVLLSSRMAEPYQTLYTTCSPTHGLYTHGPVQSPSLLYKKCKPYAIFYCPEVVRFRDR